MSSAFKFVVGDNMYPMHSLKRGFTLIELLVVITIMMTMLAIAAPFSIEVTEKAKAQTEFISFNNLLRKLSVTAFANGNGVRVELTNNSVFIHQETTSFSSVYQGESNNEHQARIDYSHLSFPPQNIAFNKNGFANVLTVKVIQRAKEKTIDMHSLHQSRG